MKTKFELSVTISPEEDDILRQAESILEKICFAFDEHNQCELCPLKNPCNRLGNMTPQGVVYAAINALTVEVEE